MDARARETGDAIVVPKLPSECQLPSRRFVVPNDVNAEFQFDFGSPNAYLAELVLPEIEARTGVKFEYVPVLLGGIYKATNNMSPADSLRGIKNKPEYQKLETERFMRRHGITRYKLNPFFPVNTLMLMRGAVAARFEGVFEPYFRAAYHHMWVEPKKMDDWRSFARRSNHPASTSTG
jgi:2-hydroxychromene-2-carboxylate isomerase